MRPACCERTAFGRRGGLPQNPGTLCPVGNCGDPVPNRSLWEPCGSAPLRANAFGRRGGLQQNAELCEGMPSKKKPLYSGFFMDI